MRLWSEDMTPAKMSERLGVRIDWIYVALDPLKEAVLDVYETGTTADAIAESKGLPVSYVKFVLRRVNASHDRPPGSGHLPLRGGRARRPVRQ